jgi:hypothetical protein
MTETSSCTPEGGLEAFADALFCRYRLDIPCEGGAEHTPLTKDKAGRRDGQGRLYRYWTCSRCQPRTKRNCRSYIEAAQKVLGREIVRDLALEILEERRTALEPYDLLEAWVRGKSLVHVVAASSKRKSFLPDRDVPIKRACVASDPASPLALPLSKTGIDARTEALKAVCAAREAIDHWITVLTETEGTPNTTRSLLNKLDGLEGIDLPADDSSYSTLSAHPLRDPLSASLSSPVLSRGLASCPIDSSAALYSSTALATPKSLRLPAAPATFRLPAHSSIDVAPRRVAAPSPDRFSDLSSLPSSPIALRKPVERLLSPCLSAAVSRPDPSSLRPSADAGGRSRARREAKRQKKRGLQRSFDCSKENVPPTQEEL